MKRLFSFLLLLFCVSVQSLWAQKAFVYGDMNGDNKLTIADLSLLTDALLGKSHSLLSYEKQVAGTWRSTGGDVITLKEDGTCVRGTATKFMYNPFGSALFFYNASGKVVEVLIMTEKNESYLKLVAPGTSTTETIYYTSSYFVSSISLNSSSVTIRKGKTYQLSATISPSTANNKSVSWSSSNTSVATVSSDGLVTGLANGTATIICSSKDGSNVKATCSVTVFEEGTYEDWTSTNHSDGSTSSHTYTIAYKSGQTLSFDWTVSSESNYDYLIVTLDGTEILRKSGEDSGSYTKTFTSSGTATLVAKYTKDGSQSNGADKGRIYNVKLSGSGASEPSTPSSKHDYVVMGGKKWSTMNLGATTVAGSYATCAGDFYAWGETTPRYTSISWSGSSVSFNGWKSGFSGGYNTYPSYTGTTLDAAHDAVASHADWGEGWRTPTNQDFKDLYAACGGTGSYIYTLPSGSKSTTAKGIYLCSNYDGVAGLLFCDGTNKLFFPASGYVYGTSHRSDGSDGYYWSSSLYANGTDLAYGLYFRSSYVNPSEYVRNRYFGYAVRPVSDILAQSEDANIIDGTFSVSSTKKVQFTKANLYWDGSAYHFEANQTDYPTSWNANHVGHFFWTSSKDYQSGKTSYMPYAQSYSCLSLSTSDKFFCGEDTPLTVDGTSGCFALSNVEWNYLISTRTNAANLRKYGVTVGGKANCLIIAPDSFSSTLKSSYTLDELSSLGLVCLPAAGYRVGSSFYDAESWGYYRSSTPDSSTLSYAYGLYFSSGNVGTDDFYYRSYGRSLRLVRLAQ